MREKQLPSPESEEEEQDGEDEMAERATRIFCLSPRARNSNGDHSTRSILASDGGGTKGIVCLQEIGPAAPGAAMEAPRRAAAGPDNVCD